MRPANTFPAAAIMSFLNTVTNLPTTNTYVVVIAMDFSKAIDTVRLHCP